MEVTNVTEVVNLNNPIALVEAQAMPPDIVEVSSGGMQGAKGDSDNGTGTELDPYVLLNVKKVAANKFHLIKENLESVVTSSQIIDGVLIVEGVNTIL